MDLTFNCAKCKQQLEADASMSGSEIECPSCGASIMIPEVDPANMRTHNPISSSAAAKEHYHFAVPVHDAPSEVLIEKPNPPLEAAGREKQLRVKCIKRTDCVEVGRDRFDEIVTDFLGKIGENNLVSITPLTYSHLDIGTRQMMSDFGVMIIYKG
jgi:DNA-directed RNA polymerase subunit RPC12/RpoP